MPLITIVENFSSMNENEGGCVGFGIFTTNSKYKPNKGVITRNNNTCHNYVIKINKQKEICR
jgi:hypothetical protein